MEILENKIINCVDLNNSRNSEWNTGDSEDNFRLHKHSTKMNPKYLTNPIEYNLNSLGYRCKEFDEYEDNNFVLIMGCSYTEGVGLHEEDLWHSFLSKKYNLPVMNLAMGGTGIDFQYYNTTLYVKNKFPRPKLVVVQYPGEFRKTFNYKSQINVVNQQHYESTGNRIRSFKADRLQTWIDENPDVPLAHDESADAQWYLNRYVVYPEQANMYNYMFFHSIKNIWNALEVPNFHWAWIDDFMPQDEDFVGVETEDACNIGYMARDLAHPGVAVQKEAWLQIEKGVEKCLSL